MIKIGDKYYRSLTEQVKKNQDDIGDTEALATVDKTIVGAINEVKSDIGTIDLSPYQTKQDDTLNTTSKNIVGAINEVFTEANGIDAVTPTDIAFDGNSNSIALFHDGTKISDRTSLDLSTKYLALNKAIPSSLTMQVGTNPNFITLDNVFVFQKDAKRVRILYSDMVNNLETIATREWVNAQPKPDLTKVKVYRHLIYIKMSADTPDTGYIYVADWLSGKNTRCDSWTDIKALWPDDYKPATLVGRYIAQTPSYQSIGKAVIISTSRMGVVEPNDSDAFPDNLEDWSNITELSSADSITDTVTEITTVLP